MLKEKVAIPFLCPYYTFGVLVSAAYTSEYAGYLGERFLMIKLDNGLVKPSVLIVPPLLRYFVLFK